MNENQKPVCKTGFIKLLLSLLLFFFFTTANAQTVTGTVSGENGKKLSSVSVTIKGTTSGTTTDEAGNYRINAGANATLVFSSVGYEPLEVPLNGKSVVNVSLQVNVRSLDTITVITALGINRQARSIGYSATNVKPEELTVNRTANPLNALEGKIAGVNISSLGTGPAGSSKIRIRGQSAITGGGNPLIVINGVPVDNSSFNGNTVGVTGGGVFADGGDGLASINPDDIESMTV